MNDINFKIVNMDKFDNVSSVDVEGLKRGYKFGHYTGTIEIELTDKVVTVTGEHYKTDYYDEYGFILV